MKQHSVVYKEVCTILSHRLIKLNKSFRYAVIKNGADLSWLSSPSVLSRLCRFLVASTKVTIYSIPSLELT